jgi:2-C-methyl-D-erythritol 2,4-cyclodiphosphate synthase
LGAAGLGDIGRHFPDSEQAFKGVDSRVLLRDVCARIGQLGFSVGNVDLTIVAQKPKLAPYISTMCSRIAEDLGVESGQVNVKATTTEGMGFEGRGEGISAYAVALIQRV